MNDTATTNTNTAPAVTAPEPLRAGHTPNLPALLRERGVSLLVTTYQAGKLVVVREQDGALNTHFRTFQAPMGLASPTAARSSPSEPPSRSGSSATSPTSPPGSSPRGRTTPASCPAPATSPATS